MTFLHFNINECNGKTNTIIVLGSAFTPRSHVARPLSRALSSPLVALGTTDGSGSISLGVSSAGTTPKVSR